MVLIKHLVKKTTLPVPEPVQVTPDKQLPDPQKNDMNFFRRRCRFDVLRYVDGRLKHDCTQFYASDLRNSGLLTRLYTSKDVESACRYWVNERILANGDNFIIDFLIDDTRDEKIAQILSEYDWDEAHGMGQASAAPSNETTADVFICHASEDKEEFVGKLAVALVKCGLKVWYDDFSLKLGDSLRQSIDRGLSISKFGVVVLSKAFFAKNWTQYELDGLAQKEMAESQKKILPIWHRVDKDDVERYSLPLAGRVAISSDRPIEEIVDKICEVVRPQE